jgi:hypothetical protein
VVDASTQTFSGGLHRREREWRLGGSHRERSGALAHQWVRGG